MYIRSEQVLLKEETFTVDAISRDARLAAVTILTARSDRSGSGAGSVAERFVEECALSTHLEPIRVEIGVAVMQYGLQALLETIDELHPGERRGLRFSTAAAGTFYDLLYQSFAKTPPPLGPALTDYSAEDDTVSDIVAGRVERDWPAALNAALAGPPDGLFRSLVIQSWFLGFASERDARWSWLWNGSAAVVAQLEVAASVTDHEPGDLLRTWGLDLAS